MSDEATSKPARAFLNASMNPRTRTPEPPYCWQSKEALRKIREHLDGDSLLPYALSVYCALTENASNKGEEEFTTLQSHLAQLGGVSMRTVQRVLPILRQLGVIAYVTPRLRGPVTFRLLSVRTSCPQVTPNRRNVPPTTKTTFQADNRNNNEITNEGTNEITHSLRAERFESECDSSLAAKAGGGEAPPARAHAREKAASAQDVRNATFAEFWAAYPRKVGKHNAERAWAKLRPPLGEVLTALEVWRNSGDWRREGGRYIPHPATWLNRGGWEDEVPDVGRNGETFL